MQGSPTSAWIGRAGARRSSAISLGRPEMTTPLQSESFRTPDWKAHSEPKSPPPPRARGREACRQRHPTRALAVIPVCALLLSFASCSAASSPRSRLFFDDLCPNAENDLAPAINVVAASNAMAKGRERVIHCLGPTGPLPEGYVLVVFGQTGCVRTIRADLPQSAEAERCLVEAYRTARIPPFREGVIRIGSSYPSCELKGKSHSCGPTQ